MQGSTAITALPVSFMWVDSTVQHEFAEVFVGQGSQFPRLVAVNPRKKLSAVRVGALEPSATHKWIITSMMSHKVRETWW
jgi:hypothetical protein